MIQIETLSDTNLPELRRISREIWVSHYPQMISMAQIEYMLNLMYGEGVVENEINNLGIFYDQIIKDSQMVGYLSYGHEVDNNIDCFKLHKCYLLTSLHGFGYGQMMLSHVLEKAKSMNFESIILNVNKGNIKGIKSYTRFGFKIIRNEVKNIGNGFVMDDYIMGYQV
ncbi:MAG: GNAT family N-acetyltransferase [Sphaerospermopsis sp. SIO1G2]|nr:GNAT family N-acetyltransferase [Sphaerospermopsis sp. SIO1G1]NET71540.1 GNAT family N-acetyltransferase [Sphaerospermopsis sp. SIO1G2]